MPQNYRAVKLIDVVKFFVVDIDGMGLNDGFLRNLGLPLSLERCREWNFCELSEIEFLHLVIPDGTHTLIREKRLDSTEGDSKSTISKWLSELKNGEEIPPLIVRTKFPGEPAEGSFYIEDGAHRAIALKVYFQKNQYKPVKAYVGK